MVIPQNHVLRFALLFALFFSSSVSSANLETAKEGPPCDIQEQMVQIAVKLSKLALDLQVNSLKEKQAWLLAMHILHRSLWLSALEAAEKVSESDYDRNEVWHFARMTSWNQARMSVFGPHTENFLDEVRQFVMEILKALPQKTPSLLFRNAEWAAFNYLEGKIEAFENIYTDRLGWMNLDLRGDENNQAHLDRYYLEHFGRLKEDEMIYLAPFLLGTILSVDEVLPQHRSIFLILKDNINWHRHVSLLLLMTARSRSEHQNCIILMLPTDIIKYLINIGLKAMRLCN